MAKDTSWSPDVVTHVVNVQWATGLAVEFGNDDKGPGEATPPPTALRKQRKK